MRIKIKKGLDIPLAGAPAAEIEDGREVGAVAVLGADYPGLKPRMLVKPGDRVGLGQALFTDKRDSRVMYTAPGAGTVAAINRGARRALQSVVIELDTDHEEVGPARIGGADPTELTPDAIREALFSSGLWTAFRTRPFSRVPQWDSTPRSVFVTAIDTRPLAADPDVVVAEHREAFSIGLQVIERLIDGPVYLCTAPGWSGPAGDGERVRHVEFSGPHPAGLPGTHIHHLDPVGADRTAWHIGCQDVIAFGTLFAEGRILTRRTVALGGDGFERPRLIRTRLGAAIEDLLAGECKSFSQVSGRLRLISGSVLDGRTAAGPEAYLGRYDVQISAIRDQGARRLFGWLGLFGRGYSAGGLVGGSRRSRSFTTSRNGRPTALVPTDAFERILPLDLLPMPLLRALLTRDTDQAQALGCLELDAEDLALCSFVCPGKNDYGAALDLNLEQIEREG